MAAKRGNPKIAEYGKATQFGKGQPVPSGGGRKKKIYTILKEKGFSKDDITTAFGEMAFYDVKELKAVAKDTSKPAIVVITAKAFLKAIEQSDYRYIKEILEQVIGKATQKVEQNTEVSISKMPNFKWGDDNTE